MFQDVPPNAVTAMVSARVCRFTEGGSATLHQNDLGQIVDLHVVQPADELAAACWVKPGAALSRAASWSTSPSVAAWSRSCMDDHQQTIAPRPDSPES